MRHRRPYPIFFSSGSRFSSLLIGTLKETSDRQWFAYHRIQTPIVSYWHPSTNCLFGSVVPRLFKLDCWVVPIRHTRCQYSRSLIQCSWRHRLGFWLLSNCAMKWSPLKGRQTLCPFCALVGNGTGLSASSFTSLVCFHMWSLSRALGDPTALPTVVAVGIISNVNRFVG
jgi:hypothetical protein